MSSWDKCKQVFIKKNIFTCYLKIVVITLWSFLKITKFYKCVKKFKINDIITNESKPKPRTNCS